MDSHTLTIWRNMQWWWKLISFVDLALGLIIFCAGVLNEDPNAFPLAAVALVMGLQMLNIGWLESKYELLAQIYVTTKIENYALKAKVARHENL